MRNIGITLRVEQDRERRDCLDQAWYGVLDAIGFRCVPLANHPVCVEDTLALVRELALEGIILSGGNDVACAPGARSVAPERDLFEERLIEAASYGGIPLLGVCRGAQMLAAYYGARVVAVDGHVATQHPLRVVTHGVIPLTDRTVVNSYHEFGLRRDGLGRELRAVAVGDDGSVEAIAHRSRQQWGIMWHPEREPRDARDRALVAALFEPNRE